MRKIWIISIFCCSCYISEEVPPDQDIWDYDLPKNQQFNQNELLLLDNRIKNDQDFGLIEGLTIIRNRKLIFENYYFNIPGRSHEKNLGRTGLTITLAALGVAIDQRLISVEDSIYKYLPEYDVIFQSDPAKLGITIRDVLMHRTGLSWNENIEDLYIFGNDSLIPNPMNNLIQMKESDDWVEFVLSRPLVGIGFYSFSTANGVLLAKILENATGVDFNTYVNEEIFSPLSINHSSIEQDAFGNFNGGDGYTLSLLDLSKIGYLYLNEGIWKGRTLLNTNFIRDAITRQHQFSQSGFENSIGYFWTFFGPGYGNSLGVEYNNIVFLVGELGQSIFIVPEENMVVTILSDNYFGINVQSVNLFAEITRATSQLE